VKALEREPDDGPLDDRLLIAAAQRQTRQFAELYEQNFGRVYAFFARRVSTREQAQDLTAEVFHQALASLRSFKWQGAPFISWLYGITANVLSAHWQKLGKDPEQLAEGWDRGATDEIERSAMLAQLVENLPPDQHNVIVQRFVLQKSIREIAQALSRSEGAVKQLQIRALETLRKRIGSQR
jgi:RNA polymerase sigma-70 factor, ECF subfamily